MRLVITGNPKLELRFVVKEILSHKPRDDWATTRQSFDLCFGPTLPRFDFIYSNKSCPAQHREVGRVLFKPRYRKSLDWRDLMIIAENTSDGFHRGVFTITAATVSEAPNVFAGIAGQGIAEIF